MIMVPAIAAANYGSGGMTFLQLVRRLHQECGVSGNPPTSVVNQSGELGRLVSWISSAWMDIQSMHANWMFMRQPVQFTTTAGQATYTSVQAQLASFGDYKRDSFRCYRFMDGPSTEQLLQWYPYDAFRDYFMYGPNRGQTNRPMFFTVDPQKNFVLGPAPNDAYVIVGEAFARPTELLANDDMPTMPSQFQMVLIYRAMMFYGRYENAPEVYQDGQLEYNTLLSRLMRDQLPEITFGAPLA